MAATLLFSGIWCAQSESDWVEHVFTEAAWLDVV